MGRVVYPDWYVGSTVRWTHDRIITRSHLSCRIPDRYDVASWIIVALAGSGALQHLRASRSVAGALLWCMQRLVALQERCYGQVLRVRREDVLGA